MQTVQVSVIIPAYNASAYVGDALESVLVQTSSPAEIIVVDDGSSDDTAAIVRRRADRVRLVSQANRGVAAARNVGVSVSSQPHVAFLDADDRWLPVKLERQLAAMDATPGCGVVYGGVRLVDVAGTELSVRLDGRSGRIGHEMLLREASVIAASSNALVPRAVFDALGGFDERLSTSADWEFFARLTRHHDAVFVPEILLEYRQHGGNMHRDVDLMARDVMLALERAFADGADPALRRRAYAIAHSVLAGSYLNAGKRRDAVAHLVRSAVSHPSTLLHVTTLPLRRLRRRVSRVR